MADDADQGDAYETALNRLVVGLKPYGLADWESERLRRGIAALVIASVSNRFTLEEAIEAAGSKATLQAAFHLIAKA